MKMYCVIAMDKTKGKMKTLVDNNFPLLLRAFITSLNTILHLVICYI